jgi:hypothetical protein
MSNRPEYMKEWNRKNRARATATHAAYVVKNRDRVRGLLCHACNVCLGFVEESTEIIDRVKLYLTKHKKLGY